MNLDDFRCMRRGISLSLLKKEDASLIEPVNRHNGKKGKVLLLLHGFSSTPAVYRYLNAAFVNYDAVVIPALPGHAENLDAFAALKANDLLVYVENLCAQLVADFEQVDVMGLSLGGLLACHLGNRFNLHHLYLLAPALDLHLATSSMITLTKVLNWLGFRYLRSKAGNIVTSDACEIAYRQLPLNSIKEVLSLIADFKFILPTCPTDLFLGRHDEVVNSQLVAERFTNHNNTSIHWLENSAHVLPLDSDSEIIIDCVNKNNA